MSLVWWPSVTKSEWDVLLRLCRCVLYVCVSVVIWLVFSSCCSILFSLSFFLSIFPYILFCSSPPVCPFISCFSCPSVFYTSVYPSILTFCLFPCHHPPSPPDRFGMAETYMRTAVALVEEGGGAAAVIPEKWSALLNNLAHTCRKLAKYEEAIHFHQQVWTGGCR